MVKAATSPTISATRIRSSSSGIELIERHLDKAGEKYLKAINDTRPESMVAMSERLSPLTRYVHDSDTILSIGVGQGEEICALYELFGDAVDIVGIDVSHVALEQCAQRIARNHLPMRLIHADATKLPFADESVNAIVLSSTLHEVFSYHANGISAWEKCVREAGRVLAPKGVLFVRDFAAPDTEVTVSLQCKTPLAMKFYEGFICTFRQFPLWGRMMDQVKLPKNYFPPLGNGIVHMPFSKAAEILLHFRSFWSDFQSGLSWIGDQEWKEADEMYLVRGEATINPVQYVDMLLSTLGSAFAVRESKLRERSVTNIFLSKHFLLTAPNDMDGIQQSTRKLECIIQKTK